MIDKYGRTISYLRISVTDRCNLRCTYCMPAAGVTMLPHEDILSFEAIADVARCAAEMGITKVRLTGGEPLVRRGIVTLVEMLGAIEGIDDLAMTTNACGSGNRAYWNTAVYYVYWRNRLTKMTKTRWRNGARN